MPAKSAYLRLSCAPDGTIVLTGDLQPHLCIEIEAQDGHRWRWRHSTTFWEPVWEKDGTPNAKLEKILARF